MSEEAQIRIRQIHISLQDFTGVSPDDQSTPNDFTHERSVRASKEVLSGGTKNSGAMQTYTATYLR